MASDNSRKDSNNYDQVFVQHTLQFSDSLKDLRNLREQLYSAAQYFESSYEKDNHRQFVVESSKEYVAKALVSTVDHLGSVADKLNKFLDQKANDFSATKLRFSFIEQRLSTFQEFGNWRGVSQHLLITEAPGTGHHHKHYHIPGIVDLGITELYRNCISCPPPPSDMQLAEQDVPFPKALLAARLMKAPLLREEQSRIRMPSNEPSSNILTFSFTKVTPNKEAGKRSISPLRFPLRRSGSFTNRSVSPSPSVNNQRCPSEPRRAISACRRREMAKQETEVESYTTRSRHLFKALLNVHRSRKDAVLRR